MVKNTLNEFSSSNNMKYFLVKIVENNSYIEYSNNKNKSLSSLGIEDLEGKPRELLQDTLTGLKNKDNKQATNKFTEFLKYIKNNPKIITTSVQVVLQLLTIR